MRVPILMYHSVREGDDYGDCPPDFRPSGYRVGPGRFERQLDILRRHGYRSIGLEELLAWHRRKLTLPEKSLLLTFDDGYLDNHRLAFPLLKKYGFRASFFISASALDEEGMMGESEIADLKAGGMEIGSHGFTHRILTGKSRLFLNRELEGSRELLEKRLNFRVDFYSLPRGYAPSGLTKEGKRAGYRGICTSIPGLNAVTTDPFRWKRMPIRTGIADKDFQSLAAGRGIRFFRIFMQEKIRALARHRFLIRRYLSV